jgi:D-alanyl-D-alanine carboxypeptidase/D-alanyl-D-alanine-endopeptidase (penicillin-binding protein 4)
MDAAALLPGMEGAIIAFSARYLDTGETILERDAGMSVSPGSNMKLLTAAAALEILGPEHRFRTRVELRGAIEGKALEGAILVIGSGDPSVGSRYGGGAWGEAELAREVDARLKAAGLKRFSGGVAIDQGAWEANPAPWGWPSGGMGEHWGALPMPFNYRENAIELLIVGEKQEGEPARIAATNPPFPGYPGRSEALTSARGGEASLKPRLDAASRGIAVGGSIPAGSAYSLRAANPGFEALFRARLSAAARPLGLSIGIEPIDPEEARGLPLALAFEMESPPLSGLVATMLGHSVNLYAECLCRAVGATAAGEPSSEAGAKAALKLFEASGLPVKGLDLKDGSGLYLGNLVTARFLAALLARMAQGPHAELYRGSLGLAAQAGTVFAHIGRGTAFAGARLKTGTLDGIKAYSGYAHGAASGRDFCYSLVANRFTCSKEEAEAAMEGILALMAEAF